MQNRPCVVPWLSLQLAVARLRGKMRSSVDIIIIWFLETQLARQHLVTVCATAPGYDGSWRRHKKLLDFFCGGWPRLPGWSSDPINKQPVKMELKIPFPLNKRKITKKRGAEKDSANNRFVHFLRCKRAASRQKNTGDSDLHNASRLK